MQSRQRKFADYIAVICSNNYELCDIGSAICVRVNHIPVDEALDGD